MILGGHWGPTFNCIEKRLTVGANYELVVETVDGGPFQGKLLGNCFFGKSLENGIIAVEWICFFSREAYKFGTLA